MNHRKKSKHWSIIIITIVIIVILVGVLVGKAVIDNKLTKIKFEDIDKSDLAINDKLYDSVSNLLSLNEFNSIKNVLLFGIDSKDSDR